MSPRGKYSFWGYVGGVFIHNLFSSYNAGRTALQNHRLIKAIKPTNPVEDILTKNKTKFNVIKEAIST
jgi:hypothetical protein